MPTLVLAVATLIMLSSSMPGAPCPCPDPATSATGCYEPASGRSGACDGGACDEAPPERDGPEGHGCDDTPCNLACCTHPPALLTAPSLAFDPEAPAGWLRFAAALVADAGARAPLLPPPRI